VTVHQDVTLHSGVLRDGDQVRYELAAGRYAWIHVAQGAIVVNGTRLEAGDAAAIDQPGVIDLAGAGGEVLLFDLA
jgi:redox-sensitive bicupin YhaK (pirin superfamily)